MTQGIARAGFVSLCGRTSGANRMTTQQRIARWFFLLVGRQPAVFALVAIAGDALGTVLVRLGFADDWAIFAIGVLCLIFYTGLLALLVVKLRAGTWKASCESMASLFDLGSSVTAMNAAVRAHPCPDCG